MIRTAKGLSLFVDGGAINVDADHPKFDDIITAVREDRWDDVRPLYNVIFKLVGGEVAKSDLDINTYTGNVSFRGRSVDATLQERLLQMVEEGFDVKPLENFLVRLHRNPSRSAVQELYGFLDASGIPVTPDGFFLAYKRVRNDYRSVHDGKTDNSIGTIVEMPRNEVDDNRDRTCSYGLHFCSYSYLKSFSGDRVVVLKIDPADVVSIPSDYNNAKGRACKYEVVGELSAEDVSKALSGGIWNTAVNTDYTDEDDMEDADRLYGEDYLEDDDDCSQPDDRRVGEWEAEAIRKMAQRQWTAAEMSGDWENIDWEAVLDPQHAADEVFSKAIRDLIEEYDVWFDNDGTNESVIDWLLDEGADLEELGLERFNPFITDEREDTEADAAGYSSGWGSGYATLTELPDPVINKEQPKPFVPTVAVGQHPNPAANWPFPTQQPTAVRTQVDTRAEFETGYRKGYADGRARRDTTFAPTGTPEFIRGYKQGVPDGRGHKRKLF